MNLQYLKYAVEVERAGSISKAAESLYMNQPNLSKAIKELESMIGVSLFNRTTKGISSLTTEGRIFMEYAKSILTQFEDMKQHLQNVPMKRNVFRLSIPRASYIAEAFTSFLRDLDAMEDFCISFYETNSLETIQSVISDGYDLGVIRYRTSYEAYFLSLLKEKGLEYRDILTADSVVLMSSNNALAHKKTLEPVDLDAMIEVANDDFAIPQHMAPDKLSESGTLMNRRQVLVYERGSQFDILSRVPNTYMWVSPMPQDVLIRNMLLQKQCLIDGIRFKDVLIFRPGHNFGHFETLLLNHIDQIKSSISQNTI